MAPLAALLERFRYSVGTAGAPAAGGGVPLDLAHDLELELRPLFAELDRIELEATALDQASAAEADRVRRSAAAEAERMVAEAEADRTETRTRSASAVIGPAQEEIQEVLARADSEAAAVRDRAGRSRNGAVAQVLRCVTGASGPVPAEEGRDVAGVDGG